MRTIIIFSALMFMSISASAQHEHHGADTTKSNVQDEPVKTDSIDIQNNMQNDMQNDMSHMYSLSLPMNRNGSGTAWLPDESPMYGYMLHSNNWMLMFHGNIFLRYTSTDITKEGSRGASMWDAPNWFMGMAQKKIGSNGLFKAGLMMSLDRLTENGDGYPLLFQSGETWNGKRLVDRQHPHDLFSELSIAYTQRIDKDIDITGYLGYPGEPALGPVAFMHRVSSYNNPDAPLSHHWQDATHITFGVGTLGVRYKQFKVEGSVFTGKEPDENRYNFDKPKFDSYSGRISVNPTQNLAMQVSYAFIKSPEPIEPDVNLHRTTASIIHSYNFSSMNKLNSTIAWGLNDKGGDHKEHSFLLESNMSLNRLNFYGRYEFIQKDPEELDLSGFEHDTKFNINAFTLGTNYRIMQFSNLNLALGIQGSLYFTPENLKSIYGANPISAQIYLKISPPLMKSHDNKHKHKH